MMDDIKMEEIMYGEDTFEIPCGLSEDFSYLLDIISPDTWNNVLTDKNRETLMGYLPDFPDNNLSEKTQTLEMFFMNKDFYFGSPLQKFFISLRRCYFNPHITRLRKIHRKLSFKNYKHKQKKYFHHLLEEILVKRKRVLDGIKDPCLGEEQTSQQMNPMVPSKRDICLQRSRKRYFKELKSVKSEAACNSELSDDDDEPWIANDKSDVSLNKKQRRQVALLESCFPSDLCLIRSTHTKGSLSLDLEAELSHSRNPFDASDEQFRNLLSKHLSKQKKGISPALDTRGITLNSILKRCESITRKPFARPPLPLPSLQEIRRHSHVALSHKKPISRKRYSRPPSRSSNLGGARGFLVNKETIKRELSSDSISSDEGIDNAVVKKEVSSASSLLQCSSLEQKPVLSAELTQETHMCFFSLLRDVICSTLSQRMTQDQLLSSVSTWQESAISPLNVWFCLSESWVQELPSALNFLCGNMGSDFVPKDFVPFIEYKSAVKFFQWIGAGRDYDTNLDPLCQYWLSHRDNVRREWPKETVLLSGVVKQERSSQPPCKMPKSFEEKSLPKPIEDKKNLVNEYHRQEKIRYNMPHRAFTYKMDGYESVIGPVKGVYSLQTGSTTKARGHLLLVPERPPYVTILSLVWDAVARLPNSEGTKMDICELVKESQFLVPINTPALENSLNGVVSGALDRLQNEKDPCVKFDTSRKLWVYLHKNRSEKELEMMHQLKFRSNSGSRNKSPATPRKVPKKRDSPALNQGPPNVVMEQNTSSIKQMDGSEVRIKDEDILKDSDKLTSVKMTKKENTNRPKGFKMSTVDRGDSNHAPKNIVSNQITQTQTSRSMVVLAHKGSEQCNEAVSHLATSIASSSACVEGIAIHSALHAQKNSRKYPPSEKTKMKVSEEGVASSSSLPSTVQTTKFNPAPSLASVAATAGVKQPKAIKLLQYSNANLQAKGVMGNASLVVDGSSALPAALLGQKLVLAGNRVLVQGGKVLHNVSTASLGGTGKQVLTGMLPGQIMTLNSFKTQSSDEQTVDGRFVQFATVDPQTGIQKQTSYQKVTLVPQFNQTATLLSNTQKNQESQTITSLPKSVLNSGEVKLKLGSTAFATASGNIINLGGKQILLTTKGNVGNKSAQIHHKGNVGNKGAQIHQVVLGDSRARVEMPKPTLTSGSGTSAPISVTCGTTLATTTSGQTQIMIPAVAGGSAGSQQRLSIAGHGGTQQIVLPASALSGSQLNLKKLQTFQSFKLVPASHFVQHQHPRARGTPVVTHIVGSSSTTSSTSGVGAKKISLQISDSNKKKENPS